MKKVIFSLICLVTNLYIKEKTTMENLSHKKRNFNHFDFKERQILENLLKQHYNVSTIANILGKHRSSIYRQINNKANTDFVRFGKKVKRFYVAKKAHSNYLKNKSNCGAKLKIFKDDKLLHYLVDSIKNKRYYPDVALGRAKRLGINFDVSVTPHTVYNYIRKGILSGVSLFDMKYMLTRKPNKQKEEEKVNKTKLGTSIELRPDYINNRLEYGHWEGDCVVDKNQNALFVLLERSMRCGKIFKLKKHDSQNVLDCINRLKKQYGKKFKHIFKTITFDNGSEFAKVFTLESEDLHMYFTHPYSSFEKGGVENYNGWIRRYIPKGTDISKISREKIQAINAQINNIPRKILNYRTPTEVFNMYLNSITA